MLATMQRNAMTSTDMQPPLPRTLLQQLLIGAAGIVLTALGILGLLVPLMPGLVFLFGAVLCFSIVSPTFKARVGVHLFRQPGYRLARRRWNNAFDLPRPQRLRLVARTALGALARGYRRPLRTQPRKEN